MTPDKGKSSNKRKVETVVISDPGKIQPQAPDLEKIAIGAIMLEKDAYSNISELLRPECFYDKRHELIF